MHRDGGAHDTAVHHTGTRDTDSHSAPPPNNTAPACSLPYCAAPEKDVLVNKITELQRVCEALLLSQMQASPRTDDGAVCRSRDTLPHLEHFTIYMHIAR